MYKQNKILKNKDYVNNPQTTEETKSFDESFQALPKTFFIKYSEMCLENMKLACKQRDVF